MEFQNTAHSDSWALGAWSCGNALELEKVEENHRKKRSEIGLQRSPIPTVT
jgi:hypothetical protein